MQAPAGGIHGRRVTLTHAAETVWLAAAVLVPLWMDPRANQAFELPKLILLLGLSGTTAAIAVIGLARRVCAVPFTLVVPLAILWLLSLGLTTRFSINPGLAWQGSYDRQAGFLLALALLGLGLGPALYLRSEAQLRRLLLAITFGSALVALYGLCQRVGLDPIGWIGRPLGVTSTLGSSTALGGYLAICLSATVGLLLVTGASPGTRISPRALTIALLGLQGTVILLTSVRAALAGAILGVVTVALLCTWRRLGHRAGAVALGALVIIAVGVLGLSALRGTSPQVDRGTLPRADTSITERGDLWRTSLRALQDAAAHHPLRLFFGHGPDTQAQVLEPWLEPRLTARLPTTRFDRAHLSVLDVTLTTGLLGLAATAGLFASALWSLAARVNAPASELPLLAGEGRVERASPSRPALAAIFGAIVAFLAESSVSFPSITSLTLMALMLGAAMGGAPEWSWTEIREAPRVLRLWIMALGTSIIVFSLLNGPRLHQHHQADRLHQQALALAAGGDLARAVNLEREACLLDPYRTIYVTQRLEWLMQWAASAPRDTNERPDVLSVSGGPVSMLQEVADLTDITPSRQLIDPFRGLLHAQAVTLLLEASPAEGRRWSKSAQFVIDRAIALAPQRVALPDAAAHLALARGEFLLALAYLQRAAALDPNQAQRIAETGHALRGLGQAAEAQAHYERAIQLDDRAAPAWWGLAQLRLDRGDSAAALEPAQRAARFQMRHWLYRRDLGRVYLALGDTVTARQELRAAARLAPAWHWDSLRAEIDALGPAD